MMPEQKCAIAVMAKAPRAGSVKTRLVPPLSVHEAAALGSSFLADVTANIQAAACHAPIQGFVAFAPVGTEELFEDIVAAGTGYVLADGSPPLRGASMGSAGASCMPPRRCSAKAMARSACSTRTAPICQRRF